MTVICDARANLNARNSAGRAPLHYAAERGSAEAVVLLCSRGANRDAADHAGNTALHIAARHGRCTAIRELLAYRYDTRVEKKRGNTALHVAALGHVGAIAAFGARLHDPNSEPIDPSRCFEAMKVLLDADCLSSEQNADRRAALHILAGGGYLEGIDLLLHSDACPNVEDNDGARPRQLDNSQRMAIPRPRARARAPARRRPGAASSLPLSTAARPTTGMTIPDLERRRGCCHPWAMSSARSMPEARVHHQVLEANLL